MKRTLALALSASFALLLGACNSDNKAVITTPEDNSASGDTAVVMNTGPDAEARYRQRARRIADRLYNDLKVKDTAVRTRIQTVYYTRAKRYGELHTQYQTDTTGQYQAMRQAEMEADKEVQTILTDPAMYKQYTTRRLDYADDKYVDQDSATEMNASDNASSVPNGAMNTGGTSRMNADGSMSSGNAAASSDAEGKAKVKIKGDDGSKLKIKDGDVKYKDANGNKTKTNGN